MPEFRVEMIRDGAEIILRVYDRDIFLGRLVMRPFQAEAFMALVEALAPVVAGSRA